MPTSFTTFNPGDVIEDTHLEQFIEPIQNLESGKSWYGVASGSGNAFEVDLDPAPSAYTEGMLINFRANHTVTSPATVNVNGLGAKVLVKDGNAGLISGDIVSGQIVSAIYDGATFQVLSGALNPTVATPAPTQNKLVYAETAKQNISTTPTSHTLPTYTFDPGKAYLLEMTVVAHGSGTSQAQVSVSDGTTTYAYPGASTYIRARVDLEPQTVYKMLPTLSGSHAISVKDTSVGCVNVKIYEIHDTLVYADFCPTTGTTVTTHNLASFTAISGHKYAMVVTFGGYTTTIVGIAAYLTNGSSNSGLPQADPTVDLAYGPRTTGIAELTQHLSGLSGAYTVVTKSKNANTVSVRIYDIT